MDVIHGIIWVALGSVFGGMARFGISGLVARSIGETFPWGTLIVNTTGALAIGIFGGLASSGQGLVSEPSSWLFVVTGFLGCYTTVSSFSLQTLSLARDGELWRATGNVLMSLILCPGLAATGFVLTTRFVQ
ncbi:fluoride efflux transporter CrcB [Rhodopseudomonas sp. NSM]|uniref:fluoride efflux transporter CrcB n=1 Tax=Rhodopseudomonas sp. NSM TaxID=3457630 RepID=UPI004036B073